MTEAFVTVERRDGVALIRLDRPTMNALSAELLPRLAAGTAFGDRSVSVVSAASATTDAAPSPTYSVNRRTT